MKNWVAGGIASDVNDFSLGGQDIKEFQDHVQTIFLFSGGWHLRAYTTMCTVPNQMYGHLAF